MSATRDEIALLKQSAEEALGKNESGTVEEFLLAVNDYLEKFEQWQAKLSPQEKENPNFKEALSELDVVHREVIFKAHAQKDLVGQEITELYKRAKVAKSYSEQGPSRISITGRRKG